MSTDVGLRRAGRGEARTKDGSEMHLNEQRNRQILAMRKEFWSW